MSEQASPAGSTNLYRQSALARLSSPEQLDRIITITSPRDWLAVATLVFFLAIAAAWSVYGSVPTIVQGSGILIATGGRVFDAFSSGDGVVSDILAKTGDVVAEGAVVARIGQSSLTLTLENARGVVNERRAQADGRKRQIEQFTASRQENLAARRRALEERMANGERRTAEVAARLVNEERLLEKRVITRQKVDESRLELATARETVLDAKSEMVKIDAEEISTRNADERDLQAAQDRLAEAERQVLELELQLRQREQVLSPAAGRVTEIKAAVGGRVVAGTPIVSIETGVTGLQLVVYLPPDQGKQVRPGMDVRISPSTVKREEHGTLIGSVLEVSEFPASAQAMQATLGNDFLVQRFSARGAPIAARVDLARDASTPSGYRWSGGAGPPTSISSGTIADAEVTVREVAPITFVIPLLRRATGMDR